MTWASLDEVAAAIPDGAWLARGGSTLGRAPIALVVALIRARRKNLRVISLPDPLVAELLVATGCASRVELLVAGLTLDDTLHPMPALARAIERGDIAWAEHDGYRIVQRLRAAAMGVPFLPAPDADSAPTTLEPPVHVTDPFTGLAVPVERAFHPDVAVIHAHAADDAGNLRIDDATATDLLVAGSARRVIATVETRVRRELSTITIPAQRVELVAHAPRGAWPSGCAGCYAPDRPALLDYLAAASAGRAASWIEAMAPRRIRKASGPSPSGPHKSAA